MKSTITTALHSGLGDMYTCIYQIHNVQEQLKQIGYEVKVIINLTRNPYKMNNNDRSVFKRIFKLDLLDNLEIVVGDFDAIIDDLKQNLIEAYKYEQIYSIYVDELVSEFNDVTHVKHSWYYRDDLPKINFFTDEVTEYCESKSKELKEGYIGLHYRPLDNEETIESDLENNKPFIKDVFEENKDKIVFVSTNKSLVKDYIKNSEYLNYYVNDFVFPNTLDGVRDLKINDDELFDVLKETLCDMYLLSKCEKIYRIANWFSAFLSFSCLYNQTNVSNKLRFYPAYPIRPM